jgi:diguanylate cyclase (GGDEF)-like protein/PAS domain S-box-containing protein
MKRTQRAGGSRRLKPPERPTDFGVEGPRQAPRQVDPTLNPAPQRWPRATVFARLLLILVGVATLPTAIVTLLQERALVSDLEGAAAARLDRARHSAARLLATHLEETASRYRAVSGTPQLRATLEVNDEATLAFYADDLAHREGAESVGFFAPGGSVVSGGPRPDLASRARSGGSEAVFRSEDGLYTYTEIALQTAASRIGSLVAVEHLGPDRLAEWSDTVGAEVAFEVQPRETDTRLVHEVRSIGGGALTVSSSLEAERAALQHARRNLAAAGLAALAVALGAGVALSRSWVRPILRMKKAAEQIGAGDFEARIASTRTDEIGDVARAFDVMAGHLHDYHREVGRQRTDLENKVRELGESQDRLRNAQELARMGSWRFDPTTAEIELSQELATILGLARRTAYHVKDLFDLVHAEDRDVLLEAASVCLHERSSLYVDHRVVLADGSERVLQTQARFMVESKSGAPHLEGTAQDITERRRVEEQVRFLAYNDTLTGLGNQRFFRERLEQTISENRRQGTSLGILLLDLDHFRRINDTLGHTVGDQLLRQVADRAVASVRETDDVARGRLPAAVSRFGGDEFTILVGGLTDLRHLTRVARRLLEVLARPFTLEGHEIVVGASIGIAAWPDDGDSGEVLLRNADAAMHHAKEQGRNHYQFYTAAMNDEAVQKLVLETRLRKAIAQNEFEVHYQPKVDGSGRRVVGAEALIRWRDPELGLVMPGEFIPIAEETGLIGELGDWVLRRSCEDRAAWCRDGMERFPVSVNLSAHQFGEEGLDQRIRAVLQETGLDPTLLELEITESVLLRDDSSVVAVLRELRRCGVRVAVDDFGTGYSSLAYLGRLPVDSLKIDRSFVRNINDAPNEAALASAIVAMGHALDLRVVAEGVEEEAQQRLLESWGCDELQGFLFARPMPADALLRWLRERR